MGVRWSYKTIHFELKKEGLLGSAFLDVPEIEQVLNDYGRGGWELVSIVETGDGIVGVLKQPINVERADIERAGSRADAVSVFPAEQNVSPETVAVIDKDLDQQIGLPEEPVANGNHASGVEQAEFPDQVQKYSASAGELNIKRPEQAVVDITAESEQSAEEDPDELREPAITENQTGQGDENDNRSPSQPEIDRENDDRVDEQDRRVGSIRIE